MKIAVLGMGYVGLSNAIMLAQHNSVIGCDISADRIAALNERRSPIQDALVQEWLQRDDLDLAFTDNLADAVRDADWVVVGVPTNYDAENNYFDTSAVEAVIRETLTVNDHATIVIKSTIPVGYVDGLRQELGTDRIIFSPEFLREGKAL